MANGRLPPKKMIAANLRWLIDSHETSPPAMEERLGGKPTRKTITNMLNAKADPRLTVLEKVAGLFGLAAWQLMAQDVSNKPASAKDALNLLDLYFKADEAGRAAIMQVASVAAQKSSG